MDWWKIIRGHCLRIIIEWCVCTPPSSTYPVLPSLSAFFVLVVCVSSVRPLPSSVCVFSVLVRVRCLCGCNVLSRWRQNRCIILYDTHTSIYPHVNIIKIVVIIMIILTHVLKMTSAHGGELNGREF